MRRSKSKYAILGALSIEPMSGYDIKTVLGRTIAHFWNEGYGQIYPTLKQLSDTGLVTSHVEANSGRPDRHIYTMTEAGWDELRHWLAQPVESEQPGRSELLLKLFFGRHAPTGTNLDHLRHHRQMLATLIDRYQAIEAELDAGTDPDRPYWLITLRHGQAVTRASLAWCDETIHRLAELEGHPQ